MWNTAIEWVERGWVPDAITRVGIRQLLKKRLYIEQQRDPGAYQKLLAELNNGPLALDTELANDQHYELPAVFFERVLGKHLKYSSGYWPEGITALDEAEAQMLALTCERANLLNGQTILELGCGWGSLSLWMAERYPDSQITAVSNAHSQRLFIESRARERNLSNLRVITADMNHFAIDEQFHRIVSVEMFEHMRNYALLFKRLRGWLREDGEVFVHIFAHRHYAYPFERGENADWMSKYFFSGGMMPSFALFEGVQNELRLSERWWVNGCHYQKTCEAWLARQDAAKTEILAVFNSVYGEDAARWMQRWRLFFMACSELFGYRQGEEWGVAHYRFTV